MKYWKGICPACEQGRLLVMNILGASKLFLLCEECDSAWASPEEVSLETYFDFGDVAIGYADATDVINAGWERYKISNS